MKTTAGVRLSDVLTAVGSVAILLTALAMMNETVHRYFAGIVSGDFRMVPVTIPDIGAQHIMRSFVDLVGRDHVGLAAFAAAGAILFVVMWRT